MSAAVSTYYNFDLWYPHGFLFPPSRLSIWFLSQVFTFLFGPFLLSRSRNTATVQSEAIPNPSSFLKIDDHWEIPHFQELNRIRAKKSRWLALSLPIRSHIEKKSVWVFQGSSTWNDITWVSQIEAVGTDISRTRPILLYKFKFEKGKSEIKMKRINSLSTKNEILHRSQSKQLPPKPFRSRLQVHSHYHICRILKFRLLDLNTW